MADFSRRTFLKAGLAAGTAPFLGTVLPAYTGSPGVAGRAYHVSLAPDAVERHPDLLKTLRDAGVGAVWLATYFYGHWPYPVERMRKARAAVEAAGLEAHWVTIPLGHPGDALGSTNGPFPLTPPAHWKMGVRADGGRHSGTSLHAPATAENVKAIADLAQLGAGDVFLDDDFRLAVSPGAIGGCYCDDHKAAFCKAAGYDDKRWADLRSDAQARRLTPALDAFLNYTCDELTASFRAQRAAWTKGRLGPMVMYLGSEKAGIRLSDYKDEILRVGEFHFDDGSFAPVRAKTAELFSSLFHRRYVAPERAFSETTAYPHDRLSAVNLGAKLAVSTLSDVRTTMFMSGLTPFPAEHWGSLKKAMKKNAEVHALVAGHVPRGPFKHYWGDRSRRVGDDNPYSLFLGAGVPFEVCDAAPADGWTFLADPDAAAFADGSVKPGGSVLVHRSGQKIDGGRALPERMEDLFALKRELVPGFKGIPFVVEDKPAVLAWYPTAKRAVLWNLSARPEAWTLRLDGKDFPVRTDGYSVESVELKT